MGIGALEHQFPVQRIGKQYAGKPAAGVDYKILPGDSGVKRELQQKAYHPGNDGGETSQHVSHDVFDGLETPEP